MANINQTPEERMKGLMRQVKITDQPTNMVDPSYQSSNMGIPQQSLPQIDMPIKNMGVGEGQPTTQDGDLTGWLKGLGNNFGISQKFGNQSDMYKSGSHPGTDFRTPSGTQIGSPVEGTVNTGYDPKGWGRYVQITMPDGQIVQFSHLKDTSDLIKELNKMKNKLIKKGQLIGTTGGDLADEGRGLSTGSHLDVSVKRGGKFINPLSQT